MTPEQMAHKPLDEIEIMTEEFIYKRARALLSIFCVSSVLIVLRFGKVPAWIRTNPIADRFDDDSKRLQKNPPSSK